MNVLVVGGAGYIGAHIVHALVQENYNVVVFDDLSHGCVENLPESATVVVGDVRDRMHLSLLFARHNIDAIIHMAALKAAGESMFVPGKYYDVNVSGIISLLQEACNAGVNKMVFSSTAAVYGEPEYVPIDEKHPINPANVYGHTKKVAEEILQWYADLGHLSYVALRYFNAAGYGDDISVPEKDAQNIFPRLMQAATEDDGTFSVFGTDYDTEDGTCIRDYIHVVDLAQAHIQALKHLNGSNLSLTLNLGSENGHSVLACIDEVKRQVGDFKVFSVARRPGDPSKVICSSSNAKQILNWRPSHSSLKEIVSSTKRLYLPAMSKD